MGGITRVKEILSMLTLVMWLMAGNDMQDYLLNSFWLISDYSKYK